MSIGLTKTLARSLAAAAILFLSTPFSHAEPSDRQTGGWSRETSDLPGVKGGYHVTTTDPNRRDDRIRSSDGNSFKLGNWDVRTWGDISFGIGASSRDHKSGH